MPNGYSLYRQVLGVGKSGIGTSKLNCRKEFKPVFMRDARACKFPNVVEILLSDCPCLCRYYKQIVGLICR
jgi:hypothetical protein